jgi:hypothetical protein
MHKCPAKCEQIFFSSAAAAHPAHQDSAGGTAIVQLEIPRGAGSDRLQVLLNEAPEGSSLKHSTFTSDGALLEPHSSPEKEIFALRTIVIAEVYPQSGKAGKPSRFPLGTYPAIPIEILRPRR